MIKSRALIWAAILLIGGFSTYSQYLNQNQSDPAAAKQVCYQTSGESVKPEYRAEGTSLRVNWVQGTVMYEGEEAVGLSVWVYDDDTNTSVCEIWVPMPEQVMGDDDMDTVGHELLHCLAGEFHR